MELNLLEQARVRRVERQGTDSVINLVDSNFLDNGFLIPTHILREGFEDWLSQRVYRPDPLGALPARQAIANFYNEGGPVSKPSEMRPRNWRADPEHILITASSSESYNLLFQTFCEPGDNILIPQPGYPLFEDLASACHIETRFYPLSASRDWQPDLDILDLVADSRTRFLVLISPNNPCGSLIPDSVLSRIAEICEKRGIMIISDEVFSEFLYESPILPRISALNTTFPVFTLNGISKLFACPDLKLSWIQVGGPDAPELMELLSLRNDSFLSCNGFSQFLLPRLFSDAAPFVRNMIKQISENRSLLPQLKDDINQTGWNISIPVAGIHGVLSAQSPRRHPSDEKIAIQLLEKEGIYLHPGSFYGFDNKTVLVFSILKENTKFAQGLARLHHALLSLV